MRGLGSGRQGARQGFATALSLLISSQRGAGGSKAAPGPLFVDAGDVLTLLDTCLEAGASMKAGVSEVPGGARLGSRGGRASGWGGGPGNAHGE